MNIMFGIAGALALLMVSSDAQVVHGKRIVHAELLTAAGDFSTPFTVGVRFTLEPKWYLYWKNPGDAGLPVEIAWDLPAGFTAGTLRFPVPEKMVYGDLVAFGYHNELLLECEITPAKEAKAGDNFRIGATLDWLVCEESCIPGSAVVKLEPRLLTRDQRAFAQSILDSWQPRFPASAQKAGITVASATVGTGSPVLCTITLTGPAAEKADDFFPEPIDQFSIAFKDISVRKGRIVLPLQPFSDGAILTEVKGLLMSGGTGYEVTVPVKSFVRP